MGLFESLSRVQELEELLKWVEEHKTHKDSTDVVLYEDLIKEIKSKIAVAKWE